MQEENEKNNLTENKTTDEQGIEVGHENKKTTGSKKDNAHNTANTGKNRPNEQDLEHGVI